MQQHDVAGPGALDGGDQVAEVDRLGVDVEERMRHRGEAGGLSDLQVVDPGRLAVEQLGVGLGGDDQVGGQAQSPGAAGRLDADEARAGIAAENDGLQQFGVDRIAVRAEVGLGGAGLQKVLLGCLDRLHDRRRAGFVAIDADAKVELVGARIVLVEPDQGEQLTEQGCGRPPGPGRGHRRFTLAVNM